MSPWEHAICVRCWRAQQGDRVPYRRIDAVSGPCCYCDTPTSDGIRVRADPATAPCGGGHG